LCAVSPPFATAHFSVAVRKHSRGWCLRCASFKSVMVRCR
jgi:hypothetical protein